MEPRLGALQHPTGGSSLGPLPHPFPQVTDRPWAAGKDSECPPRAAPLLAGRSRIFFLHPSPKASLNSPIQSGPPAGIASRLQCRPSTPARPPPSKGKVMPLLRVHLRTQPPFPSNHLPLYPALQLFLHHHHQCLLKPLRGVAKFLLGLLPGRVRSLASHPYGPSRQACHCM